MHFSQLKNMPHKLEYLFGKNGHRWRVFCCSSITIWLIIAVKLKEGWDRKSSVKMHGRSQRAQLYIIFKGLVYSLQNCQFQCDLLPDTYCIIIDKR